MREIMRTERTDRRMPTTDTSDALEELSALINAILDRIDSIIADMRNALNNVTHNLRTPIARLRTTAENALTSTDPATLKNTLANYLKESDRVITILNTLMNISEAKTETMALRLDTTNLTDLIQQNVNLYKDLAEQRDIQIQTANKGKLQIPINRNRIRQIITNLLNNAIKYTPADDRIRIETRRNNPNTVLNISDTKIKIPTDELPRI